jgi:hypothetical protein
MREVAYDPENFGSGVDPDTNLIERRCKPGRIQRAFDLGDKAEMHGKGQRIEIEEYLAAAERAD